MKKNIPFLFKKMDITKKSSKKIHFLQESFERFCENISRKCPNNEEKQQAIYRMQEACVWFCRSIAKKDFIGDEIEEIPEIESIKVEPTVEEIAEQEEDKAAWIKANAVDFKELKPVIMIKKRRFITK